MKKHILLFLFVFLYSPYLIGQVYDDFFDGDFTTNPNWIGTSDMFFVNNWKQLQSKAQGSVAAYLSTPSTVNFNASWKCSIRISTKPSAYNFSRFYLCSENVDPTMGSALYVQVGGAKRNISLCIKKNNALTILAQTEEQTVIEDDNRIELEVVFSMLGYFLSYKIGNAEYKTINAKVLDRINSNYCSVYYSCSSKNGSEYYFDNIEIKGEVNDADDLLYKDTIYSEKLIINEILFDPTTDNQEFVELYNKSDEPLPLANLMLTTKDNDGIFRSGTNLPDVVMDARSYLVVVKDAEQLCEYYGIDSCELISSVKWTRQLPNDGATLYLLYGEQIIIDSVAYSPNMHHPLLSQTKGVSLERVSPYLPSSEVTSWQSASEEAGFATPARQNSQYVDTVNINNSLYDISLLQTNFSPNGDGFEDECVINYKMPSSGYTAAINIFTPSGVKIASLAENQLLQPSGAIKWNGTTNSGSTVQVGIYVINCEFINVNSGKAYKKLLTVSVSAR